MNINDTYNYWLEKAHTNIIYNKILLIPPRHFYNLVQKSNSDYTEICNYLQKDHFC